MVEFFASSLVDGFFKSSFMGKGIVLVQLASSIVMVAAVIGKWRQLAAAALMTRRIGRDVMGGREVLEYYTARHDIAIPADIDPGDYHFMVRLTDRAGWQQLHAMAIKITE